MLIQTSLEQKARERVETRQKAKQDGLFLGQLLGYDFQEDVHRSLFVDIYDTSKHLFEQDVPKQELILWPRGHFKTTAQVVRAIQAVINFPDIRILLMQGTVKNTLGWLAEIRSHFSGENPNSKFQEYFPEFCTNKGSRQVFTTPARTRKHLKEATFTVASAKSVKAGQHYDMGFFDDLVNEQNFRNPDIVEKVTQDFNHCTPLIDPGGYRRVSGTRYTFGDLYEQIIRQNQGEWKISLRECWENGKVIFPQRTLPDGRKIGFTDELLRQIERDDPETFSAQYLNKPISAKTHLFPAEIMLSAVKPEPSNLSAPILFIDLASSRRSDSDHSVVIAGRVDPLGNMFVTDVAGDRFSPIALAETTIRMALEHRPLEILIENTSAAKFFIEYTQIIARGRNIQLPMRGLKIDNTKDAKYLRIAGLQGYVGKRLYFSSGLRHWDRIFQEFTEFPKSRHDDYADTIALMVKHFSERIPVVNPPAPNSWILRQSEQNTHPLIDTPKKDSMTMGGDFIN